MYGKRINEDDIYGRFVNATTGKLAGEEFAIAETSASESPADVVYDPINDVFLVVHTSGICESGKYRFEIKGRVVNEPISPSSFLAESVLDPGEFTFATQDSSDFL